MITSQGIVRNEAAATRAVTEVDVFFDSICPWCFIGKRRLDRALARATAPVTVRWLPFLLHPHTPPAGLERPVHLLRRFGADQRIQRLNGAVLNAGRQEGIDFAFERIQRAPNTLDSHRLIQFASRFHRAKEAVEAIFRSYFILGKDIGDRQVLLEIARQLELEEAPLLHSLDSPTEAELIRNRTFEAHRLGITGVPSFIIDGSYAISGAQEPEIFLRLFDLARLPG